MINDSMPTTYITQDELDKGMTIVDLLVKCGLAISKREARTLIKQGGISIIIPKK